VSITLLVAQVSSVVATAPPLSATAAYDVWLAELGVSDTLNPFNGDDLLHVFNGVLFDATATSVRTFWDTEGGLGLFYTAPQDETKLSVTSIPNVRAYSTKTPPNLVIRCTGTESSDRNTSTSRRAVSDGTLILFAHIGTNGNTAVAAVEVAYRVTAGSVNIVATNVTSSNACIYGYTVVGDTYVEHPILLKFAGTVAYTLTHSRSTELLQIKALELTPPKLCKYAPSPKVLIQAVNHGLAKLNKYNPVQDKSVIQELKDDPQDRMPYGVWKTPTLFNEYKGRGRITGFVTKKVVPANTPLKRLVMLHRLPEGTFVKAMWSDPITGRYAFNGVRPDCKYIVSSYDHTRRHRAVIVDNVTPTQL